MKKALTILLALTIFMSLLTGINAAAAGEVVITNASELADAIAGQQDGQIWRIRAGTYDLDAAQLAKYENINAGGQTGWYFPVVKQISIIGENNPVVTSSVEKSNGAWSSQDFISVWADGVSVEGIQIKSKIECNKAVEIMGKDFTMKNVTILENTFDDGTVFSGSVYFNTVDAGTSLLENVTLSAWISGRTVTSGSITLKDVTIDFSNNAYASDEAYGIISGSQLVNEGLTVLVDDSIANLQKQVISRVPAGTTVKLTSDLSLKQQLRISEADVILDGAGHTITASEDFTHDIEANPDNLVSLYKSNVVFKNITLKATDKNKHVLDTVESSATLNDVTLDHSEGYKGAPLIINTSTVTVGGKFIVTTGEKTWYGINLENKYDADTWIKFEKGTQFTFNNSHGKPIIFEDGINKTDVLSPENARLIKDNGVYRFIIPVTDITLSKTTLGLKTGETHTLTAVLTPNNADFTQADITWTSSDPNIATAENGKVTALKKGTVTITAEIDGKTATCTVNITEVSEETGNTDESTTSDLDSTDTSTTTVPDKGDTNTSETDINVPDTGENTGAMYFVFIGLIASGILIVLVSRKRSKSV